MTVHHQDRRSSPRQLRQLLGIDRHMEDTTDTSGCETEEEEDSRREATSATLELAPTYVHADFKNGKDKILSNSLYSTTWT